MLVHDFGKKVEVFFIFCELSKIEREKVFADVLGRKEVIQDYIRTSVLSPRISALQTLYHVSLLFVLFSSFLFLKCY